MPKAVKETMFFDKRFDRGIEWYAIYFDHGKEGQVNGEIAPTYFDVSEVPRRIGEAAPDCKIIIGLRHPAERAFSLYLHHLRKGRVSGSFGEAAKQKPRILTAGKYATHIPRWKTVFGESRVHFVFLKDIKTQPQRVLDSVCQALGIKSLEQPAHADEKVNAASMPRFPLLARGAAALTTFFHSYGLHSIVEAGKKLGLRELAYTGGEENMPELSFKDRNRLIREYEADIDFVESTTGRDLSHWRE
jgi:hypothetical protein